MNGTSGTLTSGALATEWAGRCTAAEESPTQNALNTAWDNIAQLNSAIDQLSKRLEPVISPVPTGKDGCQEETKTLIGSPLAVNIQRIGNSVANARIRLAEITARLEL
jgi:hypothetical protein